MTTEQLPDFNTSKISISKQSEQLEESFAKLSTTDMPEQNLLNKQESFASKSNQDQNLRN
jgi:hypothetical protein